ncbi:UNVERIFIED_CONTAM: hypothetical protein Sradi_5751200 [Sesamum radiatum]|uniref:Uncharacterized protein n=1 Tax=Sesamum radiatum TaxID=300843 RepID=A0AAW2L3N9_SESRA
MELGDIKTGACETLLYGFAGDVVHALVQILLPLSLGSELTRKTKMDCFLIMGMASACNVILGRPALNTLQAVVSTHHMKLMFPARAGLGEVTCDQYVRRKWYVVLIKGGN